MNELFYAFINSTERSTIYKKYVQTSAVAATSDYFSIIHNPAPSVNNVIKPTTQQKTTTLFPPLLEPSPPLAAAISSISGEQYTQGKPQSSDENSLTPDIMLKLRVWSGGPMVLTIMGSWSSPKTGPLSEMVSWRGEA
mmetsp:Transcript_16085/g.33430  ORF Transcript_16085/g.33430 Transcript_16085/m.33430 type:complete len:138 (-) Transcript_16085:218-631(-)